MIPFTLAPPDPADGHGLPLLRTPRDRPIIAVITCKHLIGCSTHFWGGRTVPHDEIDCEPCANGATYRWHGYLSAFDHRINLHFLFESTARACQPFVDWYKKHGTLRGVKFEAIRPQKRSNGRVQIRLKSTDPIEFPIPEPPNIKAALAIIWNIPLADLFDAESTKGNPAIAAQQGAAYAAARLADRLSTTPTPPPLMKPDGQLMTDEETAAHAAAIAKQTKGNGHATPAELPGNTKNPSEV